MSRKTAILRQIIMQLQKYTLFIFLMELDQHSVLIHLKENIWSVWQHVRFN